MFPIYCKHCGKATGQWKEADQPLQYMQDHCWDCMYLDIGFFDGPMVFPVCRKGIFGCKDG